MFEVEPLLNILAIRNYKLKGYDFAREALFRTSAKSYRKNLLGDWVLEDLTDDLTHLPFQAGFGVMEKEIFRRVRTFCSAGHTVVLVDSDTACVRSTEIFGRWDRMVMPWGGRNVDKPNGYQPLMSSGVIYFPPSISEIAWRVGQEAFDAMDPGTISWGDDQDCYNAMVRVDGPLIFAPELNWSVHKDMGNPIDEEASANILHFCSSRSVYGSLSAMQEALARHGVQ